MSNDKLNDHYVLANEKAKKKISSFHGKFKMYKRVSTSLCLICLNTRNTNGLVDGGISSIFACACVCVCVCLFFRQIKMTVNRVTFARKRKRPPASARLCVLCMRCCWPQRLSSGIQRLVNVAYDFRLV